LAGYIKLHRKITEWEWYRDINTTRLFIHLLLKANFRDKKYKGRIIPRGSIATTIPLLSEETALTVKEVRTALTHLKSTHEVGVERAGKESVIEVHNYEVYQVSDDDEGRDKGGKRAGEGQDKGALIEEEGKEYKENILTDIIEEPLPKNPPIQYLEIQAEYNRICTGFPKCTKLSNKRKEAIAARIHSGYSFDDFIRLFEIAQASDFLKGKNKNNWRADFDWLICDSNMAKALDGRYENRQPEQQQFQSASKQKSFSEIIAERMGDK